MSKEYNVYLHEHITAVNKAARWMLENLPVAEELTDSECKMILLGIGLHDSSKFNMAEYDAYDAYFYGEKDEDEFSRAWLHHIHVNEHHWQHWVLVNGYGKFGDPGVVTAIEMPKVHAFEMVADWWSFSWRKGDLHEVFGWYEDHKEKIVLHPNTRAYVERILSEMGERIGDEGGDRECNQR